MMSQIEVQPASGRCAAGCFSSFPQAGTGITLIYSVGPDLGSNCLQSLSADDNILHWHAKSYTIYITSKL